MDAVQWASVCMRDVEQYARQWDDYSMSVGISPFGGHRKNGIEIQQVDRRTLLAR